MSFYFSQSHLKKSAIDHDDAVNSKKTKTKTKESTMSRKNANNKIERTQSPANASDKVLDVEIKDKLLVHPVGRWFEKVNRTISVVT